MSARYEVLMSMDRDDLYVMVEEKLAQGWTLVGGVALAVEHDEEEHDLLWYAQAMVLNV